MAIDMPTERPHAHTERTVPYAVYEKVRQERDQARAEIRFREQLDKVSAKVMSPGQKTAWRVVRAAYKEGTPDDQGWVQITPAKCAEHAGMAKGTLLEHATYCEKKLDILRKRVVDIRHPDTQEIIRKDYYIALTEWSEYPLDYQVEEEREHGGRRCKCGSTNLDTRTIVTCRDCGEVVYDSKMENAVKKKKRPLKPLVVPTEQVDFMASNTIVEGSLPTKNDQSHDGKSMILDSNNPYNEFAIMALPPESKVRSTVSPAFQAMREGIREDLAAWRAEEEHSNDQ